MIYNMSIHTYQSNIYLINVIFLYALKNLESIDVSMENYITNKLIQQTKLYF